MLLLPNGCFQKRPHARLALRTLKHLFIIFSLAAGGLPGRISKKYNMQKLLEITLEHRRGISLLHNKQTQMHINASFCPFG